MINKNWNFRISMGKDTKSKYVNVRYFLSHWNYRKKEEKEWNVFVLGLYYL